MKIIDLLNKIANGEASDLTTRFIFKNKEYSFYSLNHSDYCLDKFLLNQEIKIIEEDKTIKKIKSLNNVGDCQNLITFKDKQQLNNHILKDKINEIIDKLNEEEEK